MRVSIAYLFIIILSGCKSTTTETEAQKQLADQHKLKLEARKKKELELISSFDYLSPTKFPSRCNFHDTSVKSKENDLYFTNSLLYMTPRLAKIHKVKGYVKLEYDVNNQGKLININVYEHFPNSIFDRLSIATLKAAQMDIKQPQVDDVKSDIEKELDKMMPKSPKKIDIEPVECLRLELVYDESGNKS